MTEKSTVKLPANEMAEAASIVTELLVLIQHALADETRSDTARVNLVLECGTVSSVLFERCVDPENSSKSNVGLSVADMFIHGHADKTVILSLLDRVHDFTNTNRYFRSMTDDDMQDAEHKAPSETKPLSPMCAVIMNGLDLDAFGDDPEDALRIASSVIELVSRCVSRYVYNHESFQHKDQWIAALVEREVISVAEAVCLYYMAYNRNSHHRDLITSMMQDTVWLPEQWQKDQYVRCWLYTTLNHPGKTLDHRVYLHHVEEEGEDFQGVPEPIVATMMMVKRKQYISEEEHENANTVLRTYASITTD